MPSQFKDHPRKRTVREKWDTPILNWLYEKWGTKYFYFGLPGPTIIDIKLWHEMIRRVVAFEIESESARNRRRNIEELGRNLTLLNIPYNVYCGFLEEILLDGEDRDGHKILLDELVTLFNLDFCNRISGRIDTIEGRRCKRFEALRQVVTMQRSLFRTTRSNKFVMLITARDSLHVREVKRFVSNQDLPQETEQFVSAVLNENTLPTQGYIENTELTRAFIFTFLREYLHGQNVQSIFLPPVSYIGSTERSPMIHFVVICSMETVEEAQVVDAQSAGDFLQMDIVRAGDEGLTVVTELEHQASGTDPVCYLRQFRMEEENI